MLMDMAISGLLESGMHSVPLSAIGATPSTSHTPPDGRRGLCRAHFHEFMLMTHRMVHTLETLRPKVLVKSRTGQPVHR